jgi:hypothetical protein
MKLLRRVERSIEILVASDWADRHLFKVLLGLLLGLLVGLISFCGCTGPCKSLPFANLGAHGAAFHYSFRATHILTATGVLADLPYEGLAGPLDALVDPRCL